MGGKTGVGFVWDETGVKHKPLFLAPMIEEIITAIKQDSVVLS